jgi:hypothetical protein
MEFKQVFMTADGKTFDTKAEMMDYYRQPKIREALLVLANKNAEVAEWLLNNQDGIENAFDTGTIRRVSKAEKAKLVKELAKLVSNFAEDLPFLAEHSDAVADSFRWPTVSRLSAEEKALAVKNTLLKMTADGNGEGNVELSDWIIEHKDAIIEAYGAGKEQRDISQKALDGLAEYRAKRAAEKAEEEAAKAEGEDVYKALMDKRAIEKKNEMEAKAKAEAEAKAAKAAK